MNSNDKKEWENRSGFSHHRFHSKGSGVGFAILLILSGIVLLLLNTGVIPPLYKPLIISWQMLLIVIGLWSLIKRHIITGICVLLIGVIFILPVLSAVFPEHFPEYTFNIKTFWPIILIICGAICIAFRFIPRNMRRRVAYKRMRAHIPESQTQEGDYLEKNIVFGNFEQIILSRHFKGGEVNVVFGENVIDLRKALLNNGGGKLELNTVFGSTILYIPTDWHIHINSSTLFGTIEDKRFVAEGAPDEGQEAMLMIECNSVFGLIEIRN